MNEFLKFFDEKSQVFPMHLEITYNKHTDWMIYVYKKGMAQDYPNSGRTEENDAVIVDVQDIDMELAFAKAHVELKEWLLENEGGY